MYIDPTVPVLMALALMFTMTSLFVMRRRSRLGRRTAKF
jgi:hypothetical protein